MGQRPSPEASQQSMTPSDGFTLMFLLLSGYAACFWPFLRCGFGLMALWPGGLVAMGLMLTYGLFADCPEMVFFFAAWLPLLLIHRGVTLWRVWHGWKEHSRYDGFPVVAMRVFRLDGRNEIRVKLVCEPLLVLIAGACLALWSAKLGGFVAAGSLALLGKLGIERQIESAYDRVMNDAEIVFRQRAERRSSRGA